MSNTGPYFMPNGDCIVPAGAALAARVSLRATRDGADIDITGRLFAMTVFNTATGAVAKSARMTAVGTSALLFLDGDDTNDLRAAFLDTALTIQISEILNSGYLRISEGVLEVTAGPVLPPQNGDDPSLQATDVIYVGDGASSSSASVIYVATGTPGLSAAQLLFSAGKIDAPTIEALDAYLRQQGVDAVTPLTERAETAADQADADVALTHADATATAADRVQTGLDRAAAHNDRLAADADATATATDRVQTGLDRAAAHNDRLAADADATATAADRVQTGLDRAQTGADRVQTGLDRAAAAASAAAAAGAANTAGMDLTNNSADIKIRTLDIARASNGPTGTITNGTRSNVLEFRQTGTGAPTTRIRVGGYSDEANLGFNMNYDSGLHHYDDPTRFAVWLALNGNGAAIQVSPPGYVGTDMWYGTGSGNLISWDNIGTGFANSFTMKIPGQLRWAAGNDLSGGKNYLDTGVMRLTESTGVQTLDLSRTLAGATVATNGYSGSDTWLDLKTYSGTKIRVWAGAPGEIEFTGGVTSGSPTGGNKGAGTANFKAVYDDNTLLTAYALDAAVAKSSGADPAAAIDLDYYDFLTLGREHTGARKFIARLGTEYDPLDIDKYWQHVVDKRHLPAMPNEGKVKLSIGISTGEYVQRLIETVEVQAYHIVTLKRMIDALAARFSTIDTQGA